MKISGVLKDMKKRAEDEMRRVWVHDDEFIAECAVKASILYYKKLAKALRDADPPYSNRYNDHI